MRSLEIFRPGRHTTAAGVPLEFSESDVAATAAAYDPALHEAPIVVGHPKLDAPAYGWIKGLTFAEGRLQATPDQVDPAFAEMVAAGRFKKISAAFYPPTAAANPKPGTYYLRHVGFLGAAAPAVKGLRDAAFADDADTVVIEFADWSDMVNASLWRRLRDWMIGQFGLDAADKVMPSWDVSALESDAVKESADEAGNAAMPAYSEPSRTAGKPPGEDPMSDADRARLAELEADNTRLKAEATAAAAAATRAQAEVRHAGHVTFAEKLCAEGRLLPVHKDTVVALMDRVADGAAIEFGEGDKRVAKAAIDAFTEFLQALPKQVTFAEAGAGGDLPADHADPVALAAAATEFVEAEAKAGRSISIATAVTTLQAKAAGA